jgi:hypothetical protein
VPAGVEGVVLGVIDLPTGELKNTKILIMNNLIKIV